MANTILFVCTENSARSQMAEAFFNYHNRNPNYVGTSAGTAPAKEVKPLAIAVMAERGIDIRHQTPEVLTREMAGEASRIITMGCVKSCPLTDPAKTKDWKLQDPVGKTIEVYRTVRDNIEARVKTLISRL